MTDLSPTAQARVEYENLRLEALRDFDRADASYEREQCQRRLDELIRAEEKRADDIADERARAAEREADFDRRQWEEGNDYDRTQRRADRFVAGQSSEHAAAAGGSKRSAACILRAVRQ